MYEEKEINYKKVKKEKKKKIKKAQKKSFFKKHKNKKNSFLSKINWQQLITRLLILIIVMMLIIFTISRISKHNKKENANINNNLELILNATLNMYNKDNLPQNIGDSSSILLDEMINNNLISEILDDDNNSCDKIESYIIITKNKTDEYRLKIHLKCPKKEKTTEKIITCQESCKVKE
jgi:hypothetical protein